MLPLEVQMSDGTSSLLPSLLGLSGTTELREESPAYRATLLFLVVSLSRHTLFFPCILLAQWFGSDEGPLFLRAPHYFPQIYSIHMFPNFVFLLQPEDLHSNLCWGRVVTGSLIVYQTTGMGSSPVASTTVSTGATRSLGKDQLGYNSFAWESLE